jgi:hypothetical protein
MERMCLQILFEQTVVHGLRRRGAIAIGELSAVMPRLLSTTLEKFVAGNPVWKAEIIIDVGHPVRERLARINDQYFTPRSRQINRRRKSGDSAADDECIPWLGSLHGFKKGTAPYQLLASKVRATGFSATEDVALPAACFSIIAEYSTAKAIRNFLMRTIRAELDTGTIMVAGKIGSSSE